MNNTNCPRLWNELFINSNGNVYSCCHHKPKKLGNIYREKLSDIYNNKRIQKLRKRSLEGKLSCFRSCNLLSSQETEKYQFRDLFIKTDDLRRLKIVFGEGCNINCRMCWQNSRSKKMLDFTVLKNNIDLNNFKLLDLQGGEPFYINSCLDFFSYAAEFDIEVSILTNGTIMNNKIADTLMQTSRSIKVSLNGGSKQVHEYVNKGSSWEHVLKNISFLSKIKEEQKPQFKIIGHMTIINENLDDIVNFITVSSDIGFDEIEFGYDFRVPIWLKLNPKRKKLLKEKISKVLELYSDKIPIDDQRLVKLGLIETN